MIAVGIRELKARLSAYMDLIRAGETILVKDRDEVIAEIHRPAPMPSRSKRVQAFLEEEEKAGKLKRAVRGESVPLVPTKGLALPRAAWWDLYEEQKRD